jgi:hypothetical protein
MARHARCVTEDVPRAAIDDRYAAFDPASVIADAHDDMQARRDGLRLQVDPWSRSGTGSRQPSTDSKVRPARARRRSTSVIPIAAPGVHTPPGVRVRSTSRSRHSADSAIILEVEP